MFVWMQFWWDGGWKVSAFFVVCEDTVDDIINEDTLLLCVIFDIVLADNFSSSLSSSSCLLRWGHYLLVVSFLFVYLKKWLSCFYSDRPFGFKIIRGVMSHYSSTDCVITNDTIRRNSTSSWILLNEQVMSDEEGEDLWWKWVFETLFKNTVCSNVVPVVITTTATSSETTINIGGLQSTYYSIVVFYHPLFWLAASDRRVIQHWVSIQKVQ